MKFYPKSKCEITTYKTEKLSPNETLWNNTKHYEIKDARSQIKLHLRKYIFLRRSQVTQKKVYREHLTKQEIRRGLHLEPQDRRDTAATHGFSRHDKSQSRLRLIIKWVNVISKATWHHKQSLWNIEKAKIFTLKVKTHR